MRVIPVIDLKGGQVVRAVAGERDAYAPIQSRLVSSSAPAHVAQAFVATFTATEIYVADIDALQGRPPNDEALRAIMESGVRVWLDRGIECEDDLVTLHAAIRGAEKQTSVILASESIKGAAALSAIVRSLEMERAIFSLDLKSQNTLAAEAWNNASASRILDIAVQSGLRRFIVLDLARVGISTGTGTVALCRQLRRDHPQIDLFAGGGVRGLADLQELHEAGCNGALVATALHDGRLSAHDLQEAINLWDRRY